MKLTNREREALAAFSDGEWNWSGGAGERAGHSFVHSVTGFSTRCRNLSLAGLLEAESSKTENARRVYYRITPAGRAALKEIEALEQGEEGVDERTAIRALSTDKET